MSKNKHPENDIPEDSDIDAEPGNKDKYIEELQLQVAKLEEELEGSTDKMMRYKAESENTTRRSKLDLENSHKYGVEKFAREMLDVVDSLERGLEATTESEHQQLEHVREGMELTHKMLLDTLEKFNIRLIDPVGLDFDPKLHEALTTQETSDLEPNKVLTVVQKGFAIHDRILRPARVVVAKAPQDVAS